MLASALVGAASGGLARAGRPVIDAWALPLAERGYEGALPLLRLPPVLVPRRSGPHHPAAVREMPRGR